MQIVRSVPALATICLPRISGDESMGDVTSGTRSMTTQLILYVHLGVKGLNLQQFSSTST